MEEQLIIWIKEYGYVILFIWSLMEGEVGLIMAGIMSHTGDMNIYMAIAVGSIGGFLGDQFYFYVGRHNKDYIHKEFRGQRRKFALAHLLLKKYGWPVIFVQRYLYGLRAVIPMAIGVTRYDNKMFAIINLISAIIWASATIALSYTFGETLLQGVRWVKDHYYIALPVAGLVAGAIYYYLHIATGGNKKIKKGV